MVNATDFGHGDMLEPFFLYTLQTLGFCASNMELELEDDLYRSFTGGQITAFLRGNGPCELGWRDLLYDRTAGRGTTML